MPMKTKDQALNCLSDALADALIALYVEGKQPPYVVPFAIGSGFRLECRVPGRREAVGMIKAAVKNAGKTVPEIKGAGRCRHSFAQLTTIRRPPLDAHPDTDPQAPLDCCRVGILRPSLP
jgi:hypothetical protein